MGIKYLLISHYSKANHITIRLLRTRKVTSICLAKQIRQGQDKLNYAHLHLDIVRLGGNFEQWYPGATQCGLLLVYNLKILTIDRYVRFRQCVNLAAI
jgi:hypothetical protein